VSYFHAVQRSVRKEPRFHCPEIEERLKAAGVWADAAPAVEKQGIEEELPW
jgi:hypothetical protein